MTKHRKLFYGTLACVFVLTIALMIGALTFTISTLTAKHPQAAGLDGYKLVFDDEFDAATLDRSKWSTCYDWYSHAARGCSNYGNNELEWYIDDQVSLSGGSLVLTAAKAPSVGVNGTGAPVYYPYRSGMVSTGNGDGSSKPHWLNRYGYYEARIDNPAGKGIWPAFWLLPIGTKWPPEIDIMEQTGDHPNDVLQTYFWKASDGSAAKDTSTYSASQPLTGWHTYGINWRKGAIDWYVDGKKVHGIKGSTVPSEKLEMMFNLAVGGALPGAPDESTVFPRVMKVDYVRVYTHTQ